MTPMDLHLVIRDVERNVRHMEEVVREVLLDHVAAIAATDDELLNAMSGVGLHDVPKDRVPAHLNHWLGSRLCLLGEAGTQTTGKNHGLHKRHPILEPYGT